MEKEEESYNPIELRVPYIGKEKGSYNLSSMLKELPPLRLPRKMQKRPEIIGSKKMQKTRQPLPPLKLQENR